MRRQHADMEHVDRSGGHARDEHQQDARRPEQNTAGLQAPGRSGRACRLPPASAAAPGAREQLRALENGFRIRAAEIEGWTSVPVDVPEDVPIVEAVLARQAKA